MSADQNLVSSSKKISIEVNKFYPSTMITLYEFDFRQYGLDNDSLTYANISFEGNILKPYSSLNSNTIDSPAGILRFHNLDINLENISSNLSNASLFGQIIWKGKRYIPFPVSIEGFEMISRGTLPKPKLTFSNQIDNNEYSNFFSIIKGMMRSVGDIIGVSLTRRRTFLKYLDEVNFKNKKDGTSQGGIINNDEFEIDPDPYAELPSDFFYIDRKTRENKNIVEYELSSILDLENIKLPLRTMYSDACTFDYRGEGCTYSETSNVYGNRLNNGAPIATNKDESISSLIGVSLSVGSPAEWSLQNPPLSYNKGQYVFVIRNGIKYYFVSKIDNNVASPFDANYWIADVCSKRLKGCRKRFDGTISNKGLPFGGFPATNRQT